MGRNRGSYRVQKNHLVVQEKTAAPLKVLLKMLLQTNHPLQEDGSFTIWKNWIYTIYSYEWFIWRKQIKGILATFSLDKNFKQYKLKTKESM